MNEVTDDIKNFMASTWIDQTAYREPITYAEAEANMKEWKNEGVEIPEGLTPFVFATLWNDMVEEDQ